MAKSLKVMVVSLELIALNKCVHHERTKTKFSSIVEIFSYGIETVLFRDPSGPRTKKEGFQPLLPKPQFLSLHLAIAYFWLP